MENPKTTVETTKVIQVTNKKNHYLPVKRSFDLLFALFFLIPASILIFLFGILIKLDSKGPMFYKQERLGKDGKKIFVTKLRSMRTDAEKGTGAVWAQKDDPRITRVGKFVRKTRIDELPQIFNVIMGDMSFIGPRPERPELTKKFAEEVPGFEKRLQAIPGLSGLAQIRGGYDATPAEKLVDDLEYIDNLSFKMDLSIFFQTLKVVVTGHGAH